MVFSDSEIELRQQEEIESKTRKMKFDLLMGLTSRINNFMTKDGVQYDQYGNIIRKQCSNASCVGQCVDEYGNPLSCNCGSSKANTSRQKHLNMGSCKSCWGSNIQNCRFCKTKYSIYGSQRERGIMHSRGYSYYNDGQYESLFAPQPVKKDPIKPFYTEKKRPAALNSKFLHCQGMRPFK